MKFSNALKVVVFVTPWCHAQETSLDVFGVDIAGLGDEVAEKYGDPTDDLDLVSIRQRNTIRYVELDALFSEFLAEAAGLEPDGLWLLHPDVLQFRSILASATLNGELGCEDKRRCELIQSGHLSPATLAAQPDCGHMPLMCEGQYSDTVSSCNALLDNKCKLVFEPLCKIMRKTSYNACKAVADCQLECCSAGCSGTGCANLARPRQEGQKCIACGGGPM